MTTIACNKEEMACDLQYSFNSQKWKGKPKVHKFKANEGVYEDCDFLVGFAGTAADVIALIDYFSFPDLIKPPKVKSVTGLVLTAKKEIFMFDDYNYWLRVYEPYHAIGSGGTLALGAMSAGATPLEAVKSAAKYDVFTGMGYKNFTF